MLECFTSEADRAVPIRIVQAADFQAWRDAQEGRLQRWLEANGFAGEAGTHCLVPADDGDLEAVVLTVTSADDLWSLAGLPGRLPAGDYQPRADWSDEDRRRAAVGWGLGAYRFTRYREAAMGGPRLCLEHSEAEDASETVASLGLVRDLINTPAEDMMPADLADAAADLAQFGSGQVEHVVGEGLLEQGLPLVYAVGRASQHAPRLVDLYWGDPLHPRVTLVGKGVCFDSGGLDIKPARGMRLMKKDMGGAAHVLGLARMIMAAQLPVRLRVLIPAVENAISGNALRPGDVLRSRKGLSIEIDNTDAEGRLVLADALALAGEAEPELIIDFATLTGAARVALGTEVPAYFSNDEALADGLYAAAERVQDPVWRLPLHRPYRRLLDSDIADLTNAADSPHAGAITAALFLREFVPAATQWLHLDIMGWNERGRPGRPKGGEAMGVRAVFDCLRQRYG